MGLRLASGTYGASMTIVEPPTADTVATVPISISMGSACECTVNN
jgi:hypothetical protein